MGKVRENHTKYWKTQRISDKCYFLFLIDIQMNCVLFTEMDKKILENGKKILEKSGKNRGISSVRISGNHVESNV